MQESARDRHWGLSLGSAGWPTRRARSSALCCMMCKHEPPYGLLPAGPLLQLAIRSAGPRPWPRHGPHPKLPSAPITGARALPRAAPTRARAPNYYFKKVL